MHRQDSHGLPTLTVVFPKLHVEENAHHSVFDFRHLVERTAHQAARLEVPGSPSPMWEILVEFELQHKLLSDILPQRFTIVLVSELPHNRVDLALPSFSIVVLFGLARKATLRDELHNGQQL